MPDIALGARPVSVDHTVHYQNAWLMKERLLSGGGLHGWTNSIFTGYPFNYFYAFGPYLLVLLVQGLSLGLLTLSQSYGVALFLSFLARNLMLFYMGRRVHGPLVGLTAVLFSLLDQSGSRLGGWFYSFFVGVWSQDLATILLFLGIGALAKGMQGNRRALAGYAASVAASLLTHPIAIFLVPLQGAVGLVLHGTGAGRKDILPATRRLFAATAWGVLGAAAFLVPFFLFREYATRSEPGGLQAGATWLTLPKLLTGLFTGASFEKTPPALTLMGTLGVLALAASGQYYRKVLGFLAISLLLLGADVPRQLLPIDRFTSVFDHVLLQRFGMVAKLIWYVSAAYLLIASAEAIPFGKLKLTKRKLRLASATGMGILWLGGLSAVYLGRDRNLLSLKIPAAERRIDAGARARAVEWLNARAEQPPFFHRVGLDSAPHALGDLGVELKMPTYKLTYRPASEFKYRTFLRNREQLEALNVRYVVASERAASHWEGLSLAADFGRIRILELAPWTPRAFEVIEGRGTVTPLAFTDERIRFQVGPGAEGTLRLNVSYFPRWKAYRNGTEVPLSRDLSSSVKQAGLMTLPLAPGIYELRFEPGWPEKLSPFVSLAALLSMGVVAFGWRKRRVPVRTPG